MVTLVCYIKPALSRFSNAVKINAFLFIHSVFNDMTHLNSGVVDMC